MRSEVVKVSKRIGKGYPTMPYRSQNFCINNANHCQSRTPKFRNMKFGNMNSRNMDFRNAFEPILEHAKRCLAMCYERKRTTAL